MMPSLPPTPRWFTVVAVILCLPVLLMPWLLNAPCAHESAVRTWIWLYPPYLLIAAWLAWQCYPQRRALAWILIIIMALSHAAIWMLAINGIQQL